MRIPNMLGNLRFPASKKPKVFSDLEKIRFFLWFLFYSEDKCLNMPKYELIIWEY